MPKIPASVRVPSDKEIAEAEAKLAQLRKVRDDARKAAASAALSDEILDAFGTSELISLMKKIQSRIHKEHSRIRGNPVPDELKASLIQAIREDRYTLTQLENMTGLSISYISKVKKDLKDAQRSRKQEPANASLNAYAITPVQPQTAEA